MKIGIYKPFGFSQQGMRESQQDCMYPETTSEETPYFVVCDGVGGRKNGEMASGLVCEAFSRMLDGQFRQGGTMDKALFEKILQYAYSMVYDNRCISMDMATTLAFLAISSDGVFIAHIGDSRIYQIRPGNGIVFVTEDHSVVRTLIKEKKISEEDAKTHTKRHTITRCIRVVGDDEKYDQATVNIIRDVKRGDLFIVCTDGVYGEITEAELVELLSEGVRLEAKASKLADLTRNGNDNNTAFLIEVDKVEGNEGYKLDNMSYETTLRQERDYSDSWEVLTKIGKLFRRTFSK